jgi:hypothetical protein
MPLLQPRNSRAVTHAGGADAALEAASPSFPDAV